MKTNLLKHLIMSVILSGIVFPALSSSINRFASDKPAVTYLFQHTSANPYDIKCLSWYGGIMERIVVENKSGKSITVDFQITKLANGIVVVPARTHKVTKVCEARKTAVLLDMLSLNGDSALAYSFVHQTKSADAVAEYGVAPGIRGSIAAR
jgi:hypothetical protein